MDFSSFMTQRIIEPEEVKIIVLGEVGVGTSAIAHQYYHCEFPVHGVLGLDSGVENYQRQLLIDDQPFVLSIVVPGKKSEHMSKLFSGTLEKEKENRVGYLLVYAINSRESFLRINFFRKALKQIYGKSLKIPIVLVANKDDLESERQVTQQEGREFAMKYNWNFTEISAKSNIAVDKTFMDLGKLMFLSNGLKTNGASLTPARNIATQEHILKRTASHRCVIS